MGQCYQKNKVHIYKWMANNKERKNELSKLNMQKKRMLTYLITTYNSDLGYEIMRLLNISI